MASATGIPEVVRLIWERLRDAEHAHRGGLREVAAHFHRLAPLEWLFREATPVERDGFIEFALKRRLADAMLVVLRRGFKAMLLRVRDAVSG
jgi:hypothetical protein